MCPESTEAIETMDPRRVIAGAVTQDRVVRQIFAKPDHDGAEIDPARLLCRMLGPREVIGVSGLCALAPRNGTGRFYLTERLGKRARARMDRQMRPIEASNLLGARMNVHELGLRRRDVDQRVGLRGQFAEPPANT